MTNLCCFGISLRKKLGKECISNVKCVFSGKKLSLTQNQKIGKRSGYQYK
jgi:hypothetical protein